MCKTWRPWKPSLIHFSGASATCQTVVTLVQTLSCRRRTSAVFLMTSEGVP